MLRISLEGVEEAKGSGEHLGLVLSVLSEQLVGLDCLGALLLEVEVYLLDVLLATYEATFSFLGRKWKLARLHKFVWLL